MAKYANHAWIIDRDYTEHTGDHEPRFNPHTNRHEHSVPKQFDTVDVRGPRRIHPEAEARLLAGKGQAFQMWDDDGILYYSGRWFENLESEGFTDASDFGAHSGNPLEDYGEPNAGCASMTVGNHQSYI